MQRLADIQVTAEELGAARAGDSAARRVLFERVAPATLGIIRRLVAQKALAEDLLQDTLIAMYEHLDDYRGEAPFGIWVRSIAVSRCLMAFRSPWHRARVALESWTEESWAAPAESESHLRSHRSRSCAGRAFAVDPHRGLALRRRRLVARRDRQVVRPDGEFFKVAAGARACAVTRCLADAGAIRTRHFVEE